MKRELLVKAIKRWGGEGRDISKIGLPKEAYTGQHEAWKLGRGFVWFRSLKGRGSWFIQDYGLALEDQEGDWKIHQHTNFSTPYALMPLLTYRLNSPEVEIHMEPANLADHERPPAWWLTVTGRQEGGVVPWRCSGYRLPPGHDAVVEMIKAGDLYAAADYLAEHGMWGGLNYGDTLGKKDKGG